jgi:hypothetical protein
LGVAIQGIVSPAVPIALILPMFARKDGVNLPVPMVFDLQRILLEPEIFVDKSLSKRIPVG